MPMVATKKTNTKTRFGALIHDPDFTFPRAEYANNIHYHNNNSSDLFYLYVLVVLGFSATMGLSYNVGQCPSCWWSKHAAICNRTESPMVSVTEFGLGPGRGHATITRTVNESQQTTTWQFRIFTG